MKMKSASLVAGLVLMGGLGSLQAAAPQAASKPAEGTYEAYQVQAKAALAEYQKYIPKPSALADSNAAQRDAVAAQAIPFMKQVLAHLDEMVAARPDLERPIIATRLNQEATLYALSDAETIKALEAKIKGGGVDGQMAKNVVLRGQWYRAGSDQAKQVEVVKEVAEAAASQPADLYLTQFITDIRPSVKDPAAKQQLMDLMTNTMNNQMSKAMLAQMKAADKKQSLEGKPLVLSGKQPDGKEFTTADWKGKVILVDFWAVWCAPCRAELPRVKKVYEQYHDKGLEVLGVNCDYKAQTVIRFTEQDNLPWPQLFDAEAAAKNQWHPYISQFGITGIPVMFLIDKNGVCRTVSARENFEELIPQLLAE